MTEPRLRLMNPLRRWDRQVFQSRRWDAYLVGHWKFYRHDCGSYERWAVGPLVLFRVEERPL